MKRWMISVLCAAVLFLSSCGADPDLILQNTGAAEEAVSEDGTLQDASADEAGTGSSDGESAEASGEAVSDGSVICVYICGAVSNPGVYELEEGDRIYRLVEMAGGLSEDADERSVNLAQTVEDGEMVYIPTVEESAAASETGSGTAGGAAEESSGKVNINTATADELTSLNGIGEAKAAAIVAYREEHGSFQSIEEIMQVDGIAEGTYNKIKDEITI